MPEKDVSPILQCDSSGGIGSLQSASVGDSHSFAKCSSTDYRKNLSWRDRAMSATERPLRIKGS